MVIDLNQLQQEVAAELSGRSEEENLAELLRFKVQQRVNTKKYYNRDAARKAAAKRQARIKALEAWAKEHGLYEKILQQAAQEADQILSQ